jgi:acetolactate synthase small subunit
MDTHTLSPLALDTPAALARVTALLARRGWRVDSLTVRPAD